MYIGDDMKRVSVETVTETSLFTMKCIQKRTFFFSFLNLLANNFHEIGNIQFCIQLILIRISNYLCTSFMPSAIES